MSMQIGLFNVSDDLPSVAWRRPVHSSVRPAIHTCYSSLRKHYTCDGVSISAPVFFSELVTKSLSRTLELLSMWHMEYRGPCTVLDHGWTDTKPLVST